MNTSGLLQSKWSPIAWKFIAYAKIYKNNLGIKTVLYLTYNHKNGLEGV